LGLYEADATIARVDHGCRSAAQMTIALAWGRWHGAAFRVAPCLAATPWPPSLLREPDPRSL